MRLHRPFSLLAMSVALVALAAALAIPLVRPAHAQSADVIRGTVVDAEHKPIAGASITITGQPGAVVRTATADARGEYSVVFADPAQLYLVSIRATGYNPFSQIVRKSGLSNVILANATLTGGPNVLDAMKTTAARAVPGRGEPPSVGGVEMNAMGNAIFLTDPSNLNSLAGMLPGVLAAGDSGFSVMGESPGQNRILVDGMSFDGGFLPRDAITRARMVTMTFDPSRGQFAGGETVVSTRPSSPFFAGISRLQVLHPTLAWPDPESPVEVPRVGSVSGYATGPFRRGGRALTYLVSLDANTRRTASPSLLVPRSSLLRQYGISPDTVTVMRGALLAVGASEGAGAADALDVTQGSAIARVDYRPTGITSYTLSAIGNWTRSAGVGISQLAFPTAAGDARSSVSRAMLNGATYVHDALEEWRVSWGRSTAWSAPSVDLPGGSVRVGVVYPDGRTGLGALRFGGGGQSESRQSRDLVEALNELTWSTPGMRHQIKLTQQIDVVRGRVTEAANRSGVFTYQSLADLAANRPASYTRTVANVDQRAAATSLAFSLGETWHVIPGVLDVQGGARFDRTTFGTRPRYHAAVDSTFGLRTDRVPSDAAVSPRLGMSWTPRASRTNRLPDGLVILAANGASSARMGQSAQDAGGIAIPPIGGNLTVSAGVGAFHGVIAEGRVGALASSTGLPGGAQLLRCVGDAAPVPSWSSAADAAPAACRDGTAAQPFASTEPRVTVFDPGFRAPTSWRGDVQISGLDVGPFSVVSRLTYSVGTHRESRVDANLTRTASLTLADEAQRPVYAPVDRIVPATGLIAPGAGRLSSDFGRVTDVRSDLAHRALQLVIAGVPVRPLAGRVPVYGLYVYTAQRAQVRGFNGTTAGDPFAAVWTSGPQPTHQIRLGAANVGLWWLRLAGRVDLLSGTPFTPLVSQDVNGDGMANDRAFIADPADASTDAVLARDLSALVAAASPATRRCLTSQFGAIAGANSCRTPWRAQVDVNVGFAPPQQAGNTSRLRMTTTFLNAGGALVRLLGLNRTPLGQVSSTTQVDSRLLQVTGFDPAARRYTYQVNQLFGEPVDRGSSRRRYPPFEVQIGGEYRFGYPYAVKTAERLGAIPVNGDTAAAAVRVHDELLRRYFGPEPIGPILVLRDSLKLTADQIAGIEGVRRQLAAQMDSLVAPVVTFVMSRGVQLSDAELTSRIDPTMRPLRLARDAARVRALSFLLPEQRALLDRTR